jgi:hypothetical protein
LETPTSSRPELLQVLISAGELRDRLDIIRKTIYVDVLLQEIARYWHLSLNDLESTPFDTQECLTLFESQATDAQTEDRRLELARASYALRNLMLMYLSEMIPVAYDPPALSFGREVLSVSADVLTFNYDG